MIFNNNTTTNNNRELNRENPKVFFNIQKNNVEIGKITFELYKNHCPKTAENFSRTEKESRVESLPSPNSKKFGRRPQL